MDCLKAYLLEYAMECWKCLEKVVLQTWKIPRNFIDVPSSTNDEDLFNNLSFMSSNEGGSQPSDSFYIQLADSVADITTATQVFEIPLEVGQVALLKMEGFFQQRNNSGVVGSRLFTSAVVAGAGAISITTPSIIFSGNASLTGNIFQPNATNTGVVANALALSSGDPISWNLTLYYKIVTF